jgi:hypothetical protein
LHVLIIVKTSNDQQGDVGEDVVALPSSDELTGQAELKNIGGIHKVFCDLHTDHSERDSEQRSRSRK